MSTHVDLIIMWLNWCAFQTKHPEFSTWHLFHWRQDRKCEEKHIFSFVLFTECIFTVVLDFQVSLVMETHRSPFSSTSDSDLYNTTAEPSYYAYNRSNIGYYALLATEDIVYISIILSIEIPMICLAIYAVYKWAPSSSLCWPTTAHRHTTPTASLNLRMTRLWWVSSATEMRQTTGARWAAWPGGAVTTISLWMWRRRRRLSLTSGECTLCMLLWPSMVRPWREWAAPSSWVYTSQRTSPGPTTLQH